LQMRALVRGEDYDAGDPLRGGPTGSRLAKVQVVMTRWFDIPRRERLARILRREMIQAHGHERLWLSESVVEIERELREFYEQQERGEP
jgi:hypothetical protein